MGVRELAGPVADAGLSVFGETVTVDPDARAVEIAGAFREPFEGTSTLGVAVERPEPELLVRARDWDPLAAGNGTIVRVNEARYTVVDVQSRSRIMRTLALRQY